MKFLHFLLYFLIINLLVVINNYQNKYNLKLKKLEPIEIKRLKEILNNDLFSKK